MALSAAELKLTVLLESTLSPLRVAGEEEKPVVQVQQQKKKQESNGREKYTATMEKSLRKRVKIASAMAEIDISTFIEEACKEKLEREGQ